MADISPINYLAYMPQVDLGEQIRSGLKTGMAFRALGDQRRQREQAQLAEQQYQADVAAANTLDKVAALALKYPERYQAIQAGYEGLSKAQKDADLKDTFRISSLLEKGDTEGAVSVLQRRVDASGGGDPDDVQFIDLIRRDPQAAKRLADSQIVAIAGPEKSVEAFKSFLGTPAEVAKTEAEARNIAATATQTELGLPYVAPRAEADISNVQSQIADRIEGRQIDWARLNLDTDRLTTETQLKVQELTSKPTEITGASLTMLTDSVANEAKNIALANRAEEMATAFEQSGARGGGGLSSFGEFAARQFGMQDAVSQLRGEYEQLKNGVALKNLPPGSASDADVMLALRGFPPSTANTEYVASFLRGVAKIQRAEGNAEASKAAWISENGTLGTARRDINVRGTTVPAGTTFGEFLRSGAAMQEQRNLPQRSYMKYANPSNNFVQSR